MTSRVSAIEAIEKAMEGVTHPDAPEWIAVAQDGDGPNGGFWTCAAATGESPRYIRADIYASFARQAEALQRRAEEAEALAERLKLEAQSHAQEARTANSTIYEIYQVVSGGRGEPGNWHGAKPVREKLEALQRENAEKDAEIVRLRRLAADRSYMMKAYRDMLGPTGLEVAEMWERKGVTRQHTDWGPKAYALSGEERAQVLLDADKLIGSTVNSIDTPDFGARALLGGENAE